MNDRLTKITLLLTIGLLLFLVVRLQILTTKISSSGSSGQKTEELAKPLGEVGINRTFEFSFKDPQNKPINLKFTLLSAKKVRLVATKGEPIESPTGKEFLVLSLELQNDSKYPLKVNSQDFVRLVGENEKKFAADFYNGSLDVSAISVKRDEMAFMVPKDTNNFKLLVGEIDKEKQEVEINF